MARSRARAWLLPALLLLATLLPLGLKSPYWLHLCILLFLTTATGQAWNLIGGLGGQYSVGHAKYYGLGAYATLILQGLHVPPYLGVCIGGALAVGVALVIGSITFRLRGPYFVLASIAAAEIVRLLALNWKSMTNGAEGIIATDVLDKVPAYYLGLALAAAATLLTAVVRRSRLGYQLQAIREDQDAAWSLGIPIARVKNEGLALSAALTAVAGGFGALYTGFIDPPGVLGIDVSIHIVLVCIIGGIGTVVGPILGAAVLVLLSEGLRASLAQAHALVYGVLVVLVVLFMPDGLLGFLRSLWRRRHPPMAPAPEAR
jgi:branched-chain amino acid transport system permease protein